MVALFNRAIFIKYRRKDGRNERVEFQGFDGALEGSRPNNDQLDDNDFMNDLGGADDLNVDFVEGTMQAEAFN
jgi:hypothetical protein